jgi:hypothetical protein
VSLNTILDAGDRKQRLGAIQKKLNDKHAELLGKIGDTAPADDVARRVAVKLLLGVRSLYAQFGLTPPQLCPDLQAEIATI